MRLGCTGCLSTLLALVLIAGGISFGVSAVRGVFDTPDLTAPSTTRADGLRAQRKLLGLLSGPRDRSGGPESRAPIVLSERELTAFLGRHLAAVDEMGLADIAVRLPGDGRLDVAANAPLRALLRETALARVGSFLPARWLERRVWLRLRARPRVDPSVTRPGLRYVRLDVDRFALGRQRLPTFTLRLLLAPASLRLLQWPLPDAVEAISVETGQVVIRAAS